MELPGKLTISRTNRGDSSNVMKLRITDTVSRAVVFEAEISLSEFMLALTAFAERPCRVDWVAPDQLGMKGEHKREEITMPKKAYTLRDSDPASRKLIDSLVAPYEVDGWKAAREDFANGHCIFDEPDKGRRYCNVRFYRSVPATEEDVKRGWAAYEEQVRLFERAGRVV